MVLRCVESVSVGTVPALGSRAGFVVEVFAGAQTAPASRPALSRLSYGLSPTKLRNKAA
jgi:hypothetical protein